MAAGGTQEVSSVLDRLPGERSHVGDPRTLEQGHFGAGRGGLAGEPNLATFPPPDCAFMITKGRCRGTTL
jgi:hypothetical protein